MLNHFYGSVKMTLLGVQMLTSVLQEILKNDIKFFRLFSDYII